MKTCVSCGISKRLGEFYYRRDSGKYRNKCKDCLALQDKNKYLNDTNFRERKIRQARNFNKLNKERVRDVKLLYRIKNPVRARGWVKRYYEENKDKIMARNAIYEKNNQNKVIARRKVKYEKKKGRLTPLPCKECGNLVVQAHHENYQKPLEVTWLCARCHYVYEKKKRLKKNRSQG